MIYHLSEWYDDEELTLSHEESDELREALNAFQTQASVIISHTAMPAGAAAAPINWVNFGKNFLRVATAVSPFIPGVPGQILGAILPILSKISASDTEVPLSSAS